MYFGSHSFCGYLGVGVVGALAFLGMGWEHGGGLKTRDCDGECRQYDSDDA